MIPKSIVKFYLVPGLIILVVIVIILLIPLGKKKETNETPLPTSQSLIPTSIPIPRSPSQKPTSSISPTLIPVQEFTGAEAFQELPTDVRVLGEQKTALRRRTTLTLPFGTIDFDYENDVFLVRLSDPKDQNRIQFTAWRDQNYPSLTDDEFTFN